MSGVENNIPSLCHGVSPLVTILGWSKVVSLNNAHLIVSFRSFHPVDIYADNVNSTEGLLRVLHRLQEIEGFGLLDHDRSGSYSLLLVDVSIYWRLFRLLYSYSGLAPLRHDLFLGFGFWHAYSYAHVALWNEFRLTFLGPAFFPIFPDQTLLEEYHILRVDAIGLYPNFKSELMKALQQLKTILAADDIAGVEYDTC